MTTDRRVNYLETHAPLTEDPLALMARLARSGLYDQYAVYENGPEWSYAGGALATFRLGPEVCRTEGVRDLSAVDEWLAALPVTGWRVYGWAAFELGAALAGVHMRDVDGDGGGEGDLLYLVVPASEVRVEGDRVLVRAADAGGLDQLVGLVRTQGEFRAPGELGAPVSAERVSVPLEDTGGYRDAVADALNDLRGPGPLTKVILSRRVAVPVPLDLTATYVVGRRANTPARSFLLDLGGIGAAGFSPETVVEVTGDRRVVSRPLAGTRARTGTPDEDARLRADLLSDPKEIHEHAISVKLALEDLALVCDDTCATEYMTVAERGTVQHLASTVVGRLRADRTPWQAFAALFPAVTATGIPKTPAYDLIRALEDQPRGLYAGAVLTYDSSGALDAALVLRSVFQQGGHCWLQAGAGIVRHSHPSREHEETCEKLRSIAAHLVPAPDR
ncbi:salicylate synthase [Streptomyces xylophagus]|uniref:salicylate synthase n=1 Tax=Streptomyces xylophagus TaxID=285514 RepID=UPI0005BC429E|nr:salicylate synthase [Streptomyces xylophagus]